jgi:hypothetical protein
LRKGFFSYLTSNGDLVIFRDEVLRDLSSNVQPRRFKSSVDSRKEQDRKSSKKWNHQKYSKENRSSVTASEELETELTLNDLFESVSKNDHHIISQEEINNDNNNNNNTNQDSNYHEENPESLDLPNVFASNDISRWQIFSNNTLLQSFLELILGVWKVVVSIEHKIIDSDNQVQIDSLHSSHKTKPTKCFEVEDFLSGHFSYTVDIRSSATHPVQSMDLVQYTQYREYSNTHHTSSFIGHDISDDRLEEEMVPVPSLSSLDRRLRHSLPLLVPVVRVLFASTNETFENRADEQSRLCFHVTFDYSYHPN